MKYPFYWLTAGPSKTLGLLAGTVPNEVMSFTKKKVESIYAGSVGTMSDTFPDANIQSITDIL